LYFSRSILGFDDTIISMVDNAPVSTTTEWTCCPGR